MTPAPATDAVEAIKSYMAAAELVIALRGQDEVDPDALDESARDYKAAKHNLLATLTSSRGESVCGDDSGSLCPACSLPAHELTQEPGCGAPMADDQAEAIKGLRGALHALEDRFGTQALAPALCAMERIHPQLAAMHKAASSRDVAPTQQEASE